MNKKSELQKSMFGSTLWNIWIWLTIVLVCLADVNVVVSLAIEGVTSWHLAIPIVFLALDVILALVAAFSNFRFRYSLVFPLIYAVFTLLIGVAGIAVYCAVLDYIVFTSFALISWMIFELLSVAAILLSAIRASGKGIVFGVITAVLALIFAAYSIFYIVVVAQDGFFGQGKSNAYSAEERTVTYTYNEDGDTYTASGVLDGRGGTIVVPDSMNGKKVAEVDCSIFNEDGIEYVRLLCDADVVFSNTQEIANIEGELHVSATQENIDTFKTNFYSLSVDADDEILQQGYANFASGITPEVGDDEVYIVFTYTYEDLCVLSVGNVLPTWIGKSGDTFAVASLLEEVDDPSLYERMDPSNEANLYYYYTTYDKIILNELQDPSGRAIDGEKISSSSSVGVTYETIYAVKIATNDSVYAKTEEFSKICDFMDGFRYVTGSNCDNLIVNINETARKRAGFDFEWTYDNEKTLTSLGDVVRDEMEISLVWTLDAPTISMESSKSGIYGDEITLAPEVSHTNTSTITYTYSWTSTVGSTQSSKDYTFSKAVPGDSGEYTFAVTASPSDTSLTSSASASITLNISKKTLSFEWFLDEVAVGSLTQENLTYSGIDKVLTSSVSGVLDDDATFSYTQSIENLKDATTYSLYASLDGDWGEYYEADDTSFLSLTILPYVIEVSWTLDDENCEDFEYDGNIHTISYTAKSLEEDELFDSTSTTKDGATVSEVKDAGEYVVTLTIDNSNYNLSGFVLTFSITPAPLTVTSWSYETAVYNGEVQHPEILTYEGKIGSDDITFSYTDGYKDVNTNGSFYTVTATCENPNYVIAEGAAGSFSITPAPLSVTSWSYDSAVYNGEVQRPEILAYEGKIGSDEITFSYTDGYKDVNTNDASYTVTATCENPNYVITDGGTGSYFITAYVLTVVWVDTSLVYTGDAQIATHRFEDGNGNEMTVLGQDEITDELLQVTLQGHETNAGEDYTASISCANSNYVLKDDTASTSYSISSASLTVSWGGLELTYDGTNHYEDVTYVATGAKGETITFTLTVKNSTGDTVENITNAGEYTATVIITDETARGNYTVINSVETIIVAKKTLTVSWDEAEKDFTYSGDAMMPEATVDGVCEIYDNLSDVIEYTIAGDKETDGESINAGKYSVTISVKDSNYAFSEGGTYSFEYTISPASLTVSWSGLDYTYDGENHYSEVKFEATGAKGETITFTLTVKNSNGDTVEDITNAGEYIATIEIADETARGNYTVTNPETTVTVNAASLTVSWEGLNYTYDGTNHYSGVTYEATGAKGETITFTLTVKNSSGDTVTDITNAGEYTATIEIADETARGNYTVINSVETITVAKKTLTVSWDEAKKDFTYSGEAQMPEATVEGICEGYDNLSDVIEYTVSGDKATDGVSINAGEYTVEIFVKVSNYVFAEGGTYTFDYTISAASLEVTWGDASFGYDGTDHYSNVTYVAIGAKGENIEFTLTVTNSNGDTVAEIISADSYTASIVIADETARENYVVTESTKTITVTQATVSVSWNDSQTDFTYTGYAQKPEAEVEGICEGDGADSVIAYAVSGEKVTNGASINVGTYTVEISVINSNYVFETGGTYSQTYAILQKTLTVSWEGVENDFIYSGDAKMPEASVEGVCEGYDNLRDVIEYAVSGEKATNGESIDAGTYTVEISVKDSNYALSDGGTYTFEYTISAATLEVEWSDASFTYDGTDHFGEVTFGAIGAKGEEIELTVSITFEGNVVSQIANAGEYTATVSIASETDKGNYILENFSQVISVAKASVSVTWGEGGEASFTWSDGKQISAEIAEISCAYYVYDEETETWSKTESIEAEGTYCAVLTINSDNYTFAEGATLTHEFSVSGD